MAQSNVPFCRAEPPTMAGTKSSSSSPSSSGMSESPRESSTAFSNAVLSPTRPNGMTEEPEDLEDLDEEMSPKQQDFDVNMVKLEPSESSSTLQSVPQGKKPRGRPRKHPKPEPSPPRTAKARSKTGCKTCRKRKKKCDETKPFCKNCETNNVVCEGYPEKTFWVGGVQKQRRRQLSHWQQSAPAPLPQFVQGLDEPIDWEFYHHYENELSKRLNLKNGNDNPFIGIVLPMAQAHIGVMHALLACSGSHFLKWSPQPLDEKYEDRTKHHLSKAASILRESFVRELYRDASVMCGALMLWLRTIVNGDTVGEWRHHEKYFNHVLQGQEEPRPTESVEAWNFCKEFYHYHRMSSYLTSIDRPEENMLDQLDFNSGHGDNFMTVCEGLDLPFRRVHFLRRKIRQRRDNGLSPSVPYSLMQEGNSIDAELKEIQCRQEERSDEWFCWNFYKRSLWAMLQRSVMSGPDPSPVLLAQVRECLRYYESIPESSAQQSVLVTPVFMIGTCAYEEDVRPNVLHAFDVLQAYSHNGNIPLARQIVERLWELMDQKDKRAWDYERVMIDMNIDTLLT